MPYFVITPIKTDPATRAPAAPKEWTPERALPIPDPRPDPRPEKPGAAPGGAVSCSGAACVGPLHWREPGPGEYSTQQGEQSAGGSGTRGKGSGPGVLFYVGGLALLGAGLLLIFALSEAGII